MRVDQKEINLITLAAGMGTRTVKRSIIPKPFQNVKGNAIIEWSLKSYQYLINKRIIKPHNLYFAVLKSHEKKFFISKKLKFFFGKKINIIFISKLTRGPAETALIVARKIKSNNPIIINDSDHYFNGSSLYNTIKKIKNYPSTAGIINITDTHSKKPDWSYVDVDSNNKLRGVKEKNIQLARKGARGVIGSYFFSKKNLFIKEANNLLKNKIKNEFFISSILDRLVKKKYLFLTCFTEKIYPLGNLDQIKLFEKNFNFKKFYPEPKTIIIDLDGVLIKHDSGHNSKKKIFTYPAIPIKKNVDLIKKEYDSGSCIIVMSARPNDEISNVENELKKNKIFYHQLILGVASGSRIVINDKKKNHPNIKTAIAIETVRNSSIKKTMI
jgi:bifunctional N-acetylglucosamine-1-phosphate-uridyltransferase/glucosamine-1-phosphate-acetyltransferase GlmU-like protein